MASLPTARSSTSARRRALAPAAASAVLVIAAFSPHIPAAATPAVEAPAVTGTTGPTPTVVDDAPKTLSWSMQITASYVFHDPSVGKDDTGNSSMSLSGSVPLTIGEEGAWTYTSATGAEDTWQMDDPGGGGACSPDRSTPCEFTGTLTSTTNGTMEVHTDPTVDSDGTITAVDVGPVLYDEGTSWPVEHYTDHCASNCAGVSDSSYDHTDVMDALTNTIGTGERQNDNYHLTGFITEPTTGNETLHQDLTATVPQYGGQQTNTYTVRIDWTIGGCSASAPPANPAAQSKAGSSGRSASRADVAAVSCVKITDPASNDIIGFTDPTGKYITPQAGPGEQAPAKRDLTVHGTVACGCPVTLNGVSATVSGKDWTATLPNVHPGELDLDAKGSSGGEDKASIWIAALTVDNPSEGDIDTLTLKPKNPDLEARVSLVGYPKTPPENQTVSWVVQVLGHQRLRSYWRSREWDQRGTTSGISASWDPSWGHVEGGFARLVASIDLPGIKTGTLDSDPRWFDIQGQNPGKKAVLDDISTIGDKNSDVLQHLACWESAHTYNQFNPDPDPVTAPRRHPGKAEPAVDDVPKGPFHDNPGAMRPLFGAPPAGIGIMQADPATVDQQWNWKQNILRGKAVYVGAVDASKQTEPKERKRVANQLASVLQAVNHNRIIRGLAPLVVPLIVVPDLTAKQHTRDAIRHYNGGSEYRFYADYDASPNGLEVDLTGQQKWWYALHTTNPDYVDQVRDCTGLTPLDLPDEPPLGPNKTVRYGANGSVTTVPTRTPFDIDIPGFNNHEAVTIELHSKLVVLKRVHADKDGKLAVTMRLPARVHNRALRGRHELIIKGRHAKHIYRIAIRVVAKKK